MEPFAHFEIKGGKLFRNFIESQTRTQVVRKVDMRASYPMILVTLNVFKF